MDDQYNFDINLDFLDNSGTRQVTVPEYKQSTTVMDVESLAKRIASNNELILKLKASESKNVRLQKEQQDLRDSAMSIQSLYMQERAEKTKYSMLASEWQSKCEHAESQLTNKTLHFEQLTSKIEQTNEKGPISYNDLALRYHRLALQMEDDKQLNYKERALLQSIHEYIDAKKLTALAPLKKKITAKKQMHDYSMQCNLKPEVVNQETSIDDTLPGKETRTQGTQYSWYTTTRGTNTPSVVETLKKPVETKNQATQYISSTTTRGTSTSTFIQKQSVGTNFPEVFAPVIDDIFKEMIYEVSPVSPVPECPLTAMQNKEKSRIEMKSVGTNTELRNVRKPIDYVPPNIKNSDSRPPSRNIYDRVKNETPFMGMPTMNPFVGFGLNSSPLHNTMAELWNMLGHTIFTILNNGNGQANAMNRNADTARRSERQRSRDERSNSEKDYFDEESRDYPSAATRDAATSPTLPQAFDEVDGTDFFEENYASPSSPFVPVVGTEDKSNSPFEIPKILLSMSAQEDAVDQSSVPANTSCVDEILKLFPEDSNSIPKRNAIISILKTSKNSKKERKRAKKVKSFLPEEIAENLVSKSLQEIKTQNQFFTLNKESTNSSNNLMMEQGDPAEAPFNGCRSTSNDSFLGTEPGSESVASDEVFCKPFVPPKRKQTSTLSQQVLFSDGEKNRIGADQQFCEEKMTPESDSLKKNERKRSKGEEEKEKSSVITPIPQNAHQNEKNNSQLMSNESKECKGLEGALNPSSFTSKKANRKRVRSTPDLSQRKKLHKEDDFSTIPEKIAHSTAAQKLYSTPDPASQSLMNSETSLTHGNAPNPPACKQIITEPTKRSFKPSMSSLRQRKIQQQNGNTATEKDKSINSLGLNKIEKQSDSLIRNATPSVHADETYCDINEKREKVQSLNQNKTDSDSNRSQKKPRRNSLPPKEKKSLNFTPCMEKTLKSDEKLEKLPTTGFYRSLPSLDGDILDWGFNESQNISEPKEPQKLLNMKKILSPIPEKTDCDYNESLENNTGSSASQSESTSIWSQTLHLKDERFHLGQATSSLSTTTGQIKVEISVHQSEQTTEQAEPLNSKHQNREITTELKNTQMSVYHSRTPFDLAQKREGTTIDYKIQNQTDSSLAALKQKLPHKYVFQEQPTGSGTENAQDSVPKGEEPPKCKTTPTGNKKLNLFRPYLQEVNAVLPPKEMSNEIFDSKEHSNDLIQGQENGKPKLSVLGQQKQDNYLLYDQRAVNSNEMTNLLEKDTVGENEKTTNSNFMTASEQDKRQLVEKKQRLTIEADECTNNANPSYIDISTSSSSSGEQKLFIDCPPSPETEDNLIHDLRIVKTREKITKTLPEFKTPDSCNSNNFISEFPTSSRDNFFDNFHQNSETNEVDELTISKILQDFAPPHSPISSIAPTEKLVSSEAENDMEPSKPRKYKRKSPPTAAIAAKRCTRLKMKKCASTEVLSAHPLPIIYDKEMGECTTKRTAQRNSTEKLDKGAKEGAKVDGKVDIIDNIRLGFFKEGTEQETLVPGLHERNDILPKKTVDDFNTLQQSIQDEENGPTTIADLEKVDSELDILEPFETEEERTQSPNQGEAEMDISLECHLKDVETTTSVVEPDLALEKASHSSTAFEYTPLSPPLIDQGPQETHITPETFEPKRIPTKPESNTMLSHIIANYNPEFHKIITQTYQIDKNLGEHLQSILTGFIEGVAHLMDCIRTVDIILNLTTNEIHIAHALIAIVKAVPRPEVEVPPPVPELYLSQRLRNLLSLLQQLDSRLPNLQRQLQTALEQSLFNYSKENISLESVLNLTQFYLAVISKPSNVTNAARLFICKCLYFYNHKATPMIYEALCVYPSVLPVRDDPAYDRSDALITAIQCVLMGTFYDQEKTDLKAKEMLTKLRKFYLYESFKPQRDDVIENLIAKIRAGRLKNVSYAFVLICKRMEQRNTEKFILNDRLLPLANEYYQTLSQTSENDEKVACVLECISFIIKPFHVNTDISVYMNLFGRFLNACDRQIVQEAAVASILRTIRFGYVHCFNAIYNFKPNYELTDKTKAMLKSFVYKKTKGFLKKLEHQAQVLVTTT